MELEMRLFSQWDVSPKRDAESVLIEVNHYFMYLYGRHARSL